jgi:hypothetical protein
MKNLDKYYWMSGGMTFYNERSFYLMKKSKGKWMIAFLNHPSKGVAYCINAPSDFDHLVKSGRWEEVPIEGLKSFGIIANNKKRLGK